MDSPPSSSPSLPPSPPVAPSSSATASEAEPLLPRSSTAKPLSSSFFSRLLNRRKKAPAPDSAPAPHLVAVVPAPLSSAPSSSFPSPHAASSRWSSPVWALGATALACMAAVFTSLALVSQDWIRKHNYTTATDLSAQWGLWQICGGGGADSGSSSDGVMCRAYSETSDLAALFWVSLDTNQRNLINAGATFCIFGFAAAFVCFVCLLLGYLRSHIRSKKIAFVAAIVAAVSLVLTASFMGALANQNSIIAPETAGNGSVSWTFGLCLVAMFLAIITALVAKTDLVRNVDYYMGNPDLRPWTPLLTKFPVIAHLVVAMAVTVDSTAHFGYNAMIFAVCLFAVYHHEDFPSWSRLALILLASSILLDCATLGIYGGDVLKSGSYMERFAFSGTIMSLLFKPATLFFLWREMRQHFKLLTGPLPWIQQQRPGGNQGASSSMGATGGSGGSGGSGDGEHVAGHVHAAGNTVAVSAPAGVKSIGSERALSVPLSPSTTTSAVAAGSKGASAGSSDAVASGDAAASAAASSDKPAARRRALLKAREGGTGASNTEAGVVEALAGSGTTGDVSGGDGGGGSGGGVSGGSGSGRVEATRGGGAVAPVAAAASAGGKVVAAVVHVPRAEAQAPAQHLASRPTPSLPIASSSPPHSPNAVGSSFAPALASAPVDLSATSTQNLASAISHSHAGDSLPPPASTSAVVPSRAPTELATNNLPSVAPIPLSSAAATALLASAPNSPVATVLSPADEPNVSSSSTSAPVASTNLHTDSPALPNPAQLAASVPNKEASSSLSSNVSVASTSVDPSSPSPVVDTDPASPLPLPEVSAPLLPPVADTELFGGDDILDAGDASGASAASSSTAKGGKKSSRKAGAEARKQAEAAARAAAEEEERELQRLRAEAAQRTAERIEALARAQQAEEEVMRRAREAEMEAAAANGTPLPDGSASSPGTNNAAPTKASSPTSINPALASSSALAAAPASSTAASATSASASTKRKDRSSSVNSLNSVTATSSVAATSPTSPNTPNPFAARGPPRELRHTSTAGSTDADGAGYACKECGQVFADMIIAEIHRNAVHAKRD